jgi:hypothetical protein
VSVSKTRTDEPSSRMCTFSRSVRRVRAGAVQTLMALPSFFIGNSRGTLPALVLRGLT